MLEQYDILKEVGSMCAGNATVALYELLGEKIDMEVPSVDVVSIGTVPEKICASGIIVVGLYSKILTGMKGNISIIYPEKDAYKLVDLFLKTKKEEASVLTEEGMSVVKECSNIVICSFLGILGMLIKQPIVPSTQTLSSGPVEDVIRYTFSGMGDEDYIILIEAAFKDTKRNLGGCFYLALPQNSVDVIIDNIHKEIELIRKKA